MCMAAGSSVAQPVGRNEVAMAFSVLFNNYVGANDSWPAAIDITSVVVFSWVCWLRNVTMSRDIARGGISTIYIKRNGPETPLSLLSSVGLAVHMLRSAQIHQTSPTKGSSGVRSRRFLSQQLQQNPGCASEAVRFEGDVFLL